MAILSLTPLVFETSPADGIPSPADVLAALESLMAFRLKSGGFGTTAGGRRVPHFTESTTPNAAHVAEVTVRKATEVGRRFDPGANERADLVTIAALRSAIELETSVDNYDHDRVTDWRAQLREYVTVATARGDASDEAEGGTELRAAWEFGPTCPPRAERSETRIDYPASRRLRW